MKFVVICKADASKIGYLEAIDMTDAYRVYSLAYPFCSKSAEYTLQPIEIKSEPASVDMVRSPPHYSRHPSGIECIEVTEHMNFNLGNAVKYIWRVDLKDDWKSNLEKAKFYIEREISRREKE